MLRQPCWVASRNAPVDSVPSGPVSVTSPPARSSGAHRGRSVAATAISTGTEGRRDCPGEVSGARVADDG
jgi:hypothetical protein